MGTEFDLGAFIEGSIPYVIVGLIATIGSAAAVLAADWNGTKVCYRTLALLYTHSSAFWARWPGDRLWSAPYDELAAEADRCNELIRYVGEKRMRLPVKRGPARKQAEALHAEFSEQVEREKAMYQHMLGTVHSAMNYAISQGRGPQQPYRA
ncbi:hypothetical protein A5761_30060 [Mycolicibacterium setense]|uniref:hypothetical protein n=1 Tax=Mycolicibacterium setense TaxID=431269 RepID=UPI0007EA30D0|nr:hypothetical protein [Mycolicibacterium setense]OBB21562.1 hypothetical protein A5761_30060 [Mycolicibacterium setense]